MQTLKPVRRIVTGHDSAGKAVVIDDSILAARPSPKGTSHLALVWTSIGSPIHGWRNPSETEVARVAFVLLDAKPVTVDGKPLPDIYPGTVGTS